MACAAGPNIGLVLPPFILETVVSVSSPAVVPEAEVTSSSVAPQKHLQAVRPSWVNG